jgi:hypothetical protein
MAGVATAPPVVPESAVQALWEDQKGGFDGWWQYVGPASQYLDNGRLKTSARHMQSRGTKLLLLPVAQAHWQWSAGLSGLLQNPCIST